MTFLCASFWLCISTCITWMSHTHSNSFLKMCVRNSRLNVWERMYSWHNSGCGADPLRGGTTASNIPTAVNFFTIDFHCDFLLTKLSPYLRPTKKGFDHLNGTCWKLAHCFPHFSAFSFSFSFSLGSKYCIYLYFSLIFLFHILRYLVASYFSFFIHLFSLFCQVCVCGERHRYAGVLAYFPAIAWPHICMAVNFMYQFVVVLLLPRQKIRSRLLVLNSNPESL